MSLPSVTLTSRRFQQSLARHHNVGPHSQIHVRNLTFPALIGADPWGRIESRQNINQPVKLSARISLLTPFETASETDTVDSSTVHYGILAKEILKLASNRSTTAINTVQNDWSINDLVDWLVLYLTGTSYGYPTYATRDTLATAARYTIDGGIPCLERDARFKPSLIKPQHVQELEFVVNLEKGSLLSEEIELQKKVGFGKDSEVFWCSTLRLKDMKIPCLVGVNRNERTARQIVVASVEVEPYVCKGRDFYPELEEIVFKSIEESSFETLESLAVHVAERVVKHFIIQYVPSDPIMRSVNDTVTQMSFDAKTTPTIVTVRLAKPTAVTFADSPMIEVSRSAADVLSGDVMTSGSRVPFPLEGRLDSWLERDNERK